MFYNIETWNPTKNNLLMCLRNIKYFMIMNRRNNIWENDTQLNEINFAPNAL